MTYTKNAQGFKDASQSVRKGNWEQFTDFAGTMDINSGDEAYDLKTAKEYVEKVAKVFDPSKEYKITKIYPEGFYRIYAR